MEMDKKTKWLVILSSSNNFNEYIFCDECKEYWLWDAILFYNLTDGRTLCEHCAEDIDEEEIESINDWT